MKVSSLTIGRKLALSFGLILTLLVIVALIGWLGLNRLGTAHDTSAAAYEQALFQVEKEVDHLAWVNNLANTFILGSSFSGQLDPTRCDFGQWYYDFRDSPAYSEAPESFRRTFDAIEAPHERLHHSAHDILEAQEAGNQGEALRIYRDRTLAELATLQDLFADLKQDLTRERRAADDSARTAAATATSVMGGAAVFGILVAGGLGLLITRAIVGPVRATTAHLRAIAEGDGDLTQRLPVESRDEIGDLSRAFNGFADRVHELVKQVVGAASQLAAAAEELSATSGETRQQVQHQKSEVEQVATAMNEMTSTVQEVARNAAEAAQTTRTTDEQAQTGGREVTQTIHTIETLAKEVEDAAEVIHHLSADSEEIGKVLDVIRGIAEQTNLLALNAAIEAARAGEQGRGFAVVADEVRTLASRTQESTNEVQDMIERLQSGASKAVKAMDQGRSRARDGVDQAGRAGQSLEVITRSVGTLNDMNSQIASAAEEQSAVAEEVNRNVVNINDGVEHTASGADQIASASEELARLAADLQDRVSRFKV
ncbi:methyl-accepting chemotaxis protein [Ectothiorhodospira mobilis]|uniref:methyl-accepting chemotaxis protein n=1 Tax=Ectothiorhodospira mobilis TaxID=195064 RepID=UPI001EE82AC6|nr:methyl-accepting chemotaxis protein [Ectothiorhodospira mobilis]MCG5535736.1 methyl-accepting chemotaxis protein [Ectothiorhodospira mobilis]